MGGVLRQARKGRRIRRVAGAARMSHAYEYKYVSDSVAHLLEQFRARGLLSPTSHRRDGTIEQAIWFASEMAAITVENKTKTGPRYLASAKRLFRDLKLIAHLIDRNKSVDQAGMAVFAIGRTREVRTLPASPSAHPSRSDAIETLFSHLISARAEIGRFLLCFKPDRENLRNEDPQSHAFIEEMSQAWCDFCCYPDRDIWGDREMDEREKEFAIGFKLPREHVQPFSRLLAAAWRDARLPVTNASGRSREPLERWFADRARKQLSLW
jgi:hypothetical protein